MHVGNGFYLAKPLYASLFDHQLEGVLFLWGLFKEKKGGILGDNMGLGRTVQVIATLRGLWDDEKIKTVLIVAPVELIVNWTTEFQRRAPGIDVYEFHEQTKAVRECSLHLLRSDGGVCLTSYRMVVNDSEILATDRSGSDFYWDYVILDEGHKIKNPATKCAKALHNIRVRNRIVLSGTPIMNNLKELWALFDWVHEGQLLGTAKTFKKKYETPIMKGRQKDATARQQLLGDNITQTLCTLIDPFFLRRTKQDVVMVESNAGSSALIDDIQKGIYRYFTQTPEGQELLDFSENPLPAQDLLKKICDHPRLITKKQCSSLGLEMPPGVDIDSLVAAMAQESFDISHISDNLLTMESGKVVFLISLLNNLRSENHRCLIFSQTRRMLDIVQKVMKHLGHKMCRIDGGTRRKPTRQRIIDRFTRDKSYTSFLLTTRLKGVDLTSTAADRVVIIDPSRNPATDSQAVDSAFGICQTFVVLL